MRISAAVIVICFCTCSADGDGLAPDRGPADHARAAASLLRLHRPRRTIPWNESGRYILALRTRFQDRMPKPDDAAEIVLIDTRAQPVERVDQSRAWNPQQGTMFYWNPEAPETQFFFNDRDPETHKSSPCSTMSRRGGACASTASTRRRSATAAWRSGAAGSSRSTTAGWRACDASPAIRALRLHHRRDAPGGRRHPRGGRGRRARRLLVSFKQLADLCGPAHPDVDGKALFINHTLWSRDDSRIYFFVRAEFDDRSSGSTSRHDPADGTGLTMHAHSAAIPSGIGPAHDWRRRRRQVIYDVTTGGGRDDRCA